MDCRINRRKLGDSGVAQNLLGLAGPRDHCTYRLVIENPSLCHGGHIPAHRNKRTKLLREGDCFSKPDSCKGLTDIESRSILIVVAVIP